MFTLDVVIEALADATVDDLGEVFQYCSQQIDRHWDAEVAEIDEQMAKLKARRDVIRPPEIESVANYKTGRRTYKEIVNPNNPDEVYRTGPHPAWLTQMLKEELGDKYGDKVEMALLISLWKKVGMK